jgi:dihydrofolate reductase
MFVGYWPQVALDPNASPADLMIAGELAQMNKIVFSTTLKESGWENTRLVSSGMIDEVKKLKAGNGPDITLFGSGTIVQQLAGAGLIDEYLVVLTPAVVGAGKLLFKDVPQSSLELLEARTFRSGNVLLHYKSAAPES